jgi:hypothetical protein
MEVLGMPWQALTLVQINAAIYCTYNTFYMSLKIDPKLSFSRYMELAKGKLFTKLHNPLAGHFLNRRRDEFCANVTLREGFLIDEIVICHGCKVENQLPF